MPKNKIIPQMFDVRPVDETGGLGWGKDDFYDRDSDQKKDVSTKESQFERSVNAYIMGVAIESEKAPILHDPDFDLNQIAKEQEQKMQQYKRELIIRQQKERELKILQERQLAEKQKRLEKEALINKQKEILQQRETQRKFEQQKIIEKQKLQEEHAQIQRLKQAQKQQELLEKQREYTRQQEAFRQLHAERLLEQQRLKEETLKIEKQRKDQERLAIIEKEKQKLVEQQQQIFEKIKYFHEEKEALILQKREEQAKKEERARIEAVQYQQQLKKINEQNKKKQQEYEAFVLAQREEQERLQAEILMQNEIESIKAKKREEKKRRKEEKNFFSKLKNRRSNLVSNKWSDNFSFSDLLFPRSFAFQRNTHSPMVSFVVTAIFLMLGIATISFASKGLGLKSKILGASADGYTNLTAAMADMTHQNFEGSSQQFDEAISNFSQGSEQLQEMGGVLLDVTKYIPFASKISSGKNAVEAGRHFSAAGKSLNEVIKISSNIKNPIDSSQNQPSLLDVLESAEKNIAIAKSELDAAQQNVDNISIDDLPSDKQQKFLLLKQKLPDIRSALDLFLNNSHILVDLLGGNGPRKYLFLFQNNSEIRATGGFIGTYGLLDIANGRIKKFFIDGIFNPDGQLRDKIVPPVPIQKISAAWSMHDSNWFPDFPLSARKAINFYEKTGGPTADGVISFTPAVMQKLLQITGPISMPEYDVTLDADNFLELTQYKVEVDYDKQENKPKKILADLAPLVLDKLLNSKDIDTITKTAQAILEGLQQKHILFYSENTELQNIIRQQGWSGEVLPASKDYISVINTNINGYKTDAIIDETIDHKAEIQKDGSIIDTVTITRKHNGGGSQYEWLNKVNADYMRVYVPEGSKLIEVSGQTREQNAPPLDYKSLGFKNDPDVQKEEESIVIDPESGTRVYEESGKTVFANWTYVSPQETMTITYKYLLPFSMFKVAVGNQQIDSYSLIAQKQSGSFGSKFNSHVYFPSELKLAWNFPSNIKQNANEIDNSATLENDRFEGLVFEKK